MMLLLGGGQSLREQLKGGQGSEWSMEGTDEERG